MDEKLTQCCESLTTLLAQELDLYGEMERLLRAEKEALLQCRHDQIVQSNHLKEAILHRIEALQRSRREIIRQIAAGLNTDSSTINMTYLLYHLQGSPAERLRRCQEEVRDILQRVRSLNMENKQLAETALAFTRGWLTYFHQLASPQAGYRANGQIQSQAINGRMVSRKE